MKKYILILVVTLFSTTSVLADGGPPPPEECACCRDDFTDENGTLPGYDACVTACEAGQNPCSNIPIDDQSSLMLLIVAGASLGIYFIFKNKKRKQLEI